MQAKTPANTLTLCHTPFSRYRHRDRERPPGCHNVCQVSSHHSAKLHLNGRALTRRRKHARVIVIHLSEVPDAAHRGLLQLPRSFRGRQPQQGAVHRCRR